MNPDSVLSVDFVPAVEDLRCIAEWQLARSAAARDRVSRLTIGSTLFFLSMFGAALLVRSGTAIAVLILMAILVLIWGRGSPRNLIHAWVRRNIVRISKKHLQKEGFAKLYVFADAAALRKGRTRQETTSYSWPGVTAIEKSAGGAFFLSREEILLFLPVRAFASNEEFLAFIDQCETFWRSATPRSNKCESAPSIAAPHPDSLRKGEAGKTIGNVPDYQRPIKRSPLAAISLGLGIAATLLLPLFPLAILLGIAAIATGIIARRNRTVSSVPPSKTRFATWGIVLGVCSSITALILTMLLTAAVVDVWTSVRGVVKSAMPVVQSANRTSALFNAAAISQGCREYAIGHNGAFPEDLSILLITRACTPQQLHDPISSTPLFPSSRIPAHVSDWHVIAHDVADSSDFVYAGRGLVLTAIDPSLLSDLIVVYGRDLRAGRGRVIAFADGNARFVPVKELRSVFLKSNQARHRIGLEPLTIDSPQPASRRQSHQPDGPNRAG